MGRPEIVITIRVSDSDEVGVHTHASYIPEPQVRPMLDRAIAALQAERDALETCPFHAREHSSPPQVSQPIRDDQP